MHRRSDLLKHLYREDDDPKGLGRLLEDDALRREYQALSEVKHHLDRKPRRRPDPAVLDSLFVQVVTKQPIPGERVDRAARRPVRLLRFRALGVVGPLLVLFVAGTLGLNTVLRHRAAEAPTKAVQSLAAETASPAPQQSELQPAVVADAASELQAQPVEPKAEELAAVAARPPQALAVPVAQPASRQALRLALPAESSAPKAKAKPTPVVFDWDDSDEVLEVHRQVRLVEARSGAASWDEPALEPPVEGEAGRETATDAIEVESAQE